MTRKEKAADRLLKAVAHYVETHNGKAIVVGGIEIITYPDDRKLNFRLSVRVTGRKPEKDKTNDR